MKVKPILNTNWQMLWLVCTRKRCTLQKRILLHLPMLGMRVAVNTRVALCPAVVYAINIVCISDHLHCMNCCATVENIKFDTHNRQLFARITVSAGENGELSE